MRSMFEMRNASAPLVILVAAAASAQGGGPLSFSDEALSRGMFFNIGVNFTQFGAGLMMGDLDNDNDLDIVIANGPGGSFGVFENDGTGNFTNRTPTAGLLPMNRPGGIAAADYDNDGDLDIFVSGWYTNSRLYRNNGDFTFTDVAIASGIVDNGPLMAASWGDVNLDGHLDLYISVRTFNNGYPGPNFFYMNNGDGTFTDRAVEMNIDAEGDPTLVSAFFDFDRDGDDDLYLGTDKGSGPNLTNRLYRNDAGSFTEITTQARAEANLDCMGIAVGDLNFDGYYDLYLTNVPLGNKLLMHDGVGGYDDRTLEADVGSYRLGWGTLFADFDNDTELDIYVCNFQGANRLYRGSQNWPLIDEAPSAGVDEDSGVYCVAEGDVDGDGDIDLLVGHTNGRAHLYINNSADAATNNWVRFNVVGNTGAKNSYGVGTCVDITTGSKSQVRQVRAGTNYKTTSEFTLHFGLADANIVDTVDVIYPGNSEIRTLTNVPVNHTWTLYPSNRLGDPNGNGRIDYFELYEAVISRTGPGNPIEPGLEIYDMDGDFDLDNDDLALMDLGIRTARPKRFNAGP